jgi:acetyl-CoA carboxylase carboxyltransferase component
MVKRAEAGIMGAEGRVKIAQQTMIMTLNKVAKDAEDARAEGQEAEKSRVK